jgi:hypothetical protein
MAAGRIRGYALSRTSGAKGMLAIFEGIPVPTLLGNVQAMWRLGANHNSFLLSFPHAFSGNPEFLELLDPR